MARAARASGLPRRGPLARSWWGRAFIDAMEAIDDAGRLARGRTCARGGNVLDLTISRGAASARVHGGQDRPYRVVVELTPLDDEAQAALVELVSSHPAYLTALLRGELEEGLADASREAGIPLLPSGASELRFSCTCPDWGEPCIHGAAVVYALGARLDDDPFALLALRGVGREQLIESAIAAGALEPDAESHGVLDPDTLPHDSFAELSAPLPDLPSWRGVRWAIRDLDPGLLGRDDRWVDTWLGPLYEAITTCPELRDDSGGYRELAYPPEP